jgi:hypothetical protein
MAPLFSRPVAQTHKTAISDPRLSAAPVRGLVIRPHATRPRIRRYVEVVCENV